MAHLIPYNRGFVLVTVLMLTFVMHLFLFSLYNGLNTEQQIDMQTYYRAAEIAQKLLKKTIIKVNNQSQALKSRTIPWQQEGYQGKIIIQQIAEINCLHNAHNKVLNKKQSLTAIIYDIHISTDSIKGVGFTHKLQAYFAKDVNNKIVCDQETRPFIFGLLSKVSE